MKDKRSLIAIVPFVILVLIFELAPLTSIMINSLTDTNGQFTLQNFIRIFTTNLYRDSIAGSLQISLISSLIGIVIAFLGVKAMNSSGKILRGFFGSVLNITSNFAGIPLAFAFIILLGNAGILTLIGKQWGISFLKNFNIYSLNGLMLTYVYFQIPLATLLLLPSFHILKEEWREVVAMSGGNATIYWFKIALPNLLPALLGTFSVLFANAIAAYATGYALLSGNAMLLPIRISEQFVGDIISDKHFGSALAVVLMALMVITALILNVWQHRCKGGEDIEKQ